MCNLKQRQLKTAQYLMDEFYHGGTVVDVKDGEGIHEILIILDDGEEVKAVGGFACDVKNGVIE